MEEKNNQKQKLKSRKALIESSFRWGKRYLASRKKHCPHLKNDIRIAVTKELMVELNQSINLSLSMRQIQLKYRKSVLTTMNDYKMKRRREKIMKKLEAEDKISSVRIFSEKEKTDYLAGR